MEDFIINRATSDNRIMKEVLDKIDAAKIPSYEKHRALPYCYLPHRNISLIDILYILIIFAFVVALIIAASMNFRLQ